MPYAERAFLGGASDLRAFRNQQVGPWEFWCFEDDDRVYAIPRGGLLSGLLASELRYDAGWGVTWATFAEVGLLSDRLPSAAELGGALRTSFEVGLRYQSVVGPIRLDLAMRPLYPEDAQAPLPPGCEDLVGIRRFDLLPRIRNPNLAEFPVAINLMLAIGEAM